MDFYTNILSVQIFRIGLVTIILFTTISKYHIFHITQPCEPRERNIVNNKLTFGILTNYHLLCMLLSVV